MTGALRSVRFHKNIWSIRTHIWSIMQCNSLCPLFYPLKRLFDTDWHQLKLLVRPKRVTCFVDDIYVEEQLLDGVVPIYINGMTQVAKKVNIETTVPVGGSMNILFSCNSIALHAKHFVFWSGPIYLLLYIHSNMSYCASITYSLLAFYTFYTFIWVVLNKMI